MALFMLVQILMCFQFKSLCDRAFHDWVARGLTDGQLFGLLWFGCGLPRNVYVFRKPNRQMRELMRDVRLVFISDIVRESARLCPAAGVGASDALHW